MAAVVASVWTFHYTDFASRRMGATAIAAVVFIGIAVSIFFVGQAVDARTNAAPHNVAEVNKQATVSVTVAPVQSPTNGSTAGPPLSSSVSEGTSTIPRTGRKSNSNARNTIGNDNTVVNAPIPPSMGDGNTIVGATDSNGNAIYNKGGTAIGRGAKADSTSIAIGAGANAGATSVVQNNVQGINIGPGATVVNPQVFNQSPPATILWKVIDYAPNGNEFVSHWAITVSGAAIPQLIAEVHAVSLIRAVVSPPLVMGLGLSDLRDGSMTSSINNVFGRLTLEAHLKEAGDPINVAFSCGGIECIVRPER